MDQAHNLSEPRREASAPAPANSWRDDPDGRALTRAMAVGLMRTLRTMRPTWAEVAIMRALEDVRDTDPALVCAAAMAAARRPANGPDSLALSGPWWDEAQEFLHPPAPVVIVARPSAKSKREAGGHTRLNDPTFMTARARAYEKHVEQARLAGGTVIERDHHDLTAE